MSGESKLRWRVDLAVPIERYRGTILLAEVLFAWYAIQYVTAFHLGIGVETLHWWFALESTTSPSPGWVLSTISHSFSRPFTHLGLNVLMLLVFGGLAEPHLHRREYVAFFFAVGIAASLAHVAITGNSVIGASGAIFGLTLYSTSHYLRHHGDELDLYPAADLPRLAGVKRMTKSLFIVLVPLLAFGIVAGQLLGVYPAGVSAVVSHGVGGALGIAYERFRPIVSTPPCADDGGMPRL